MDGVEAGHVRYLTGRKVLSQAYRKPQWVRLEPNRYYQLAIVIRWPVSRTAEESIHRHFDLSLQRGEKRLFVAEGPTAVKPARIEEIDIDSVKLVVI